MANTSGTKSKRSKPPGTATASEAVLGVTEAEAEAAFGSMMENVRRLMTPRDATEGGMSDAKRLAEALVRLKDPASVVELQQRLVREYMDMFRGGAAAAALLRGRLTDFTKAPGHNTPPQRSAQVESVAVPTELLRAARERTGIGSDAELVAFALSLLADPSDDGFMEEIGSLPGHTLDY